MKKFNRALALLLVLIMALSLCACGKSSSSAPTGGGDDATDAPTTGDDETPAPSTGDDEVDTSGEGKVINIYCWNDEFSIRFNNIYPKVKETSSDGTVTTLEDGTEVHFIINPNQDGVYQQKLDEALLNQASAAADDKIDIFLAETDYINKYSAADAGAAMALSDLGIDPDTDMADQFSFTRVVASDENGVQRGTTWQCCPGVLVYRRDIAKDVWGTDDPEEIGQKTKDWDTFKASAAELKEKGYYALACYHDSFRLYSNNTSNPWVEPGSTTVNVDKKITDWITDAKEWKDAGYYDPNVKGQWNNEWYTAMSPSSKVFAFLFPAWGIDSQIKTNWGNGGDGSWAVTTPPLGYNWGGTFLCAAEGTDNPALVKDIILQMTANKDNLLAISKKYQDFTNTVSGMKEAAEDDSFASDFLGGQNPFKYFTPSADNIVMAALSPYDQGCVEECQSAFGDYFEGKVDYDKAKSNYEKAVKERYPELTEIKWPD